MSPKTSPSRSHVVARRRRPRNVLAAACVVALLMAAGAAVSGAGRPRAAAALRPVHSTRLTAPIVRYDLALGDSLAVGVGASQPADGYVDLVYRHQLARKPGLQLEDLACSGATTTSMIVGGEWCPYAAGTQLAAAESFIRSHPGQISFVTIDIGLNDIDGCMTDTTVDARCVADGLRKAGTDLATILAGLRSADRSIVIYGADYYDPFLAAWSNGAAGRATPRRTSWLSTTSWPGATTASMHRSLRSPPGSTPWTSAPHPRPRGRRCRRTSHGCARGRGCARPATSTLTTSVTLSWPELSTPSSTPTGTSRACSQALPMPDVHPCR